MVDDAILSREAAYIYQYAVGFSPVNGNLHRWRGIVEDNSGRSAAMEVEIPPDFPNNPPILTLPGSTQHPRVDSNGHIRTRSIQQWNPGNHVYNVIREAKTVINKGSFQSIQATQSSSEEQTLRQQISTLKSQIGDKKREYQQLEQTAHHEVAKNQNLDELIDDTLIEVENEAYALEEAYDSLDIKGIDFAKQFVDARRRYYLIESSKK